MINLAVPNLEGNERRYLNECIDTTFVSSVGPFVNRLEQMVCSATGAKYGVATSSGTTGLHLALMGVGVNKNDLVIIPSFTFIATANAVMHCGAEPWCMDIEKSSWTLDADILQYELESKTFEKNGEIIHRDTGKRVAAIMPVYTLGTPADMEKMQRISKKYKLPIVVDAAAAIGATYNNRKIGEIADLTVFSFNGNKTITCGGGGMVVGNNEELLQKIRHISTTARVGVQYEHDMIGYNYRMTNVQAAIGCAQMERLDKFIEKKRYIRAFYNNILKDNSKIELFPSGNNCESACWFSGVVIKEGGLEKVLDICEYLATKEIQAKSFWKPVHLQKPYIYVQKSNMQISEGLWDRIITLPCSTNITDKELNYVANIITDIL